MTADVTGPPPGLLARAEQQYTGCQRMLDYYVGIAAEAAHLHNAPPAQVWATVARDLLEGQTADDHDEGYVALVGVFGAAVVEVLEGRRGRDPGR